MSGHIHDGRSHCPACALEKIGWQKQEIADLEAENARLQTRVEERERCGDCADSPEDIRLPARYRCYFCDKQFCGPHAKTHFKEGRKTATALAETERELATLTDAIMQHLGGEPLERTCGCPLGEVLDDLPESAWDIWEKTQRDRILSKEGE